MKLSFQFLSSISLEQVFLAGGGVLVAAGIILMFIFSLRRLRKRREEESEPPSYCMRDDFLSEAEFAFYVTLHTYLGEQVVICPKVNLGDLFFAAGEKERRLSLTNKINRKHVDFLLCEPGTMRPLCGVELDDSSHLRADRIERDAFVDSVYEAAGLPLIHVPLQDGYTPEELQEAFLQVLDFSWDVIDSENEEERLSLGEHTIPVCPKCGELMVLRVYSSGEKKGYRYYGCPNYPKCKTVVDYVTGRVGRV